MVKWYVTATVGPLFTEYSVIRMVEIAPGVWKRDAMSSNTSTELVSMLNAEDQLEALAMELMAERSAEPWRQRA